MLGQLFTSARPGTCFCSSRSRLVVGPCLYYRAQFRRTLRSVGSELVPKLGRVRPAGSGPGASLYYRAQFRGVSRSVVPGLVATRVGDSRLGATQVGPRAYALQHTHTLCVRRVTHCPTHTSLVVTTGVPPAARSSPGSFPNSSVSGQPGPVRASSVGSGRISILPCAVSGGARAPSVSTLGAGPSWRFPVSSPRPRSSIFPCAVSGRGAGLEPASATRGSYRRTIYSGIASDSIFPRAVSEDLEPASAIVPRRSVDRVRETLYYRAQFRGGGADLEPTLATCAPYRHTLYSSIAETLTLDFAAPATDVTADSSHLHGHHHGRARRTSTLADTSTFPGAVSGNLEPASAIVTDARCPVWRGSSRRPIDAPYIVVVLKRRLWILQRRRPRSLRTRSICRPRRRWGNLGAGNNPTVTTGQLYFRGVPSRLVFGAAAIPVAPRSPIYGCWPRRLACRRQRSPSSLGPKLGAGPSWSLRDDLAGRDRAVPIDTPYIVVLLKHAARSPSYLRVLGNGQLTRTHLAETTGAVTVSGVRARTRQNSRLQFPAVHGPSPILTGRHR